MCTRGWPPWLLLVDMWAAYAKAVSEHAPQAQVLFDRFHLGQHLNRAVDEVRRAEMRRLSRLRPSDGYTTVAAAFSPQVPYWGEPERTKSPETNYIGLVRR